MSALLLVQVLVLIVIFLVVLTQWAIPLWRGTPVLPIFRGERRIERELERARQRRLEVELEQRLKREKNIYPIHDGQVTLGGITPPRLEEHYHTTTGEGDGPVPH